MQQAAAHWREYAIEATCLGLFMISAAGMTTLLQHPASPVAGWSEVPVLRRVPMGLAMGLTSAALIYSPLGARSGAHMNPAVTLTFLRLRKIAPIDAAGYVLAQFGGALAGIATATFVLAGLPAHPSVNYAATVPGRTGLLIAFAAELVISFVLMSLVLRMSNTPRLSRFTGLGASLLVATYIIVEAPISGMSMNPARTLGSNAFASLFSTLWIYFVAPPVGMLLAGEWYARRHGRARVRCAKLHHPDSIPCIFQCGYKEPIHELERTV
jgi:aquaporin Z